MTVLLVPTLVLTDDEVVVTAPTLVVVTLEMYVPTASIDVEATTADDVVEPTLVVTLDMVELVVLTLVVTLVTSPVDTDVEVDVTKHNQNQFYSKKMMNPLLPSVIEVPAS